MLHDETLDPPSIVNNRQTGGYFLSAVGFAGIVVISTASRIGETGVQHYKNTKRGNLLGLLSEGMGKIQGTWIIAMPAADCTRF